MTENINRILELFETLLVREQRAPVRELAKAADDNPHRNPLSPPQRIEPDELLTDVERFGTIPSQVALDDSLVE